MPFARELIGGDENSSPRQAKRDQIERLAAVLFMVAATIFLLLLGAFEPIENRLTNLRAQLLDRPPSRQVVIVEIDAKSVSEISTWPWSRHYHAEALDRLRSAGAVMVAFDVDFSSPSEKTGDRAFADALRRMQPTILPIFQQRASDDASESWVISREPAQIFDSAWVGGVNIFPDADGVVREYPAATMIGGEIRPSIAALLAENDDWGDRRFSPDWGIDARQIPRFSFVDVVKGRVPREAIEGKRILIGATAIELGDLHTVPRYGIMPGVVIQALATESLLQQRALSRSGALPTLFGTILIALLLAGIEFRRFDRTFPAAAAATLALLVTAPVAIQAHWPLSVDSAAMLFCAAGCIAGRVLLEIRRRAALSALVDPETGLGNRRALEARLAASGDSGPILIAAAIERFASIRDVVGTEALAGLVREASARARNLADGPVYRIAPDILAWIRPPDGAAVAPVGAAAELFNMPIQTPAGDVDVQLTLGVDDEPSPGCGVSKVERALAAISAARAAGLACQSYRGPNPAIRRQLSILGELRKGMAAGEVTVAYQPKLDLRTGAISGAEALVRWQHPVDGVIPPDEFIPLAESTGAIRELTDFVLRTAAGDSTRLRAMRRPIQLAVNISAPDLANPDFAAAVASILAGSGADPGSLMLEVTESAIIRSTGAAVQVLTELRKSGIKLAIDDYGTGQSTLSYLKQMPVHELKIDKSFVTSICDSENDRIMVRSTIDLAHQLGLKVVAEGVEDAAILQLLRSLGCDLAQGYFVGRAMPFEQLYQMANGEASEPRVA